MKTASRLAIHPGAAAVGHALRGNSTRTVESKERLGRDILVEFGSVSDAASSVVRVRRDMCLAILQALQRQACA